MDPFEIAKFVAGGGAAAGAGFTLARKTAEGAAATFTRLVGPSIDRAGERLADRLFPEKAAGDDLASVTVHWRNRNAALILVRAAEMLEADRVEVREVPRSWVLPLLDAGSVVEHDDLRERWARLLANGVACEEHRHPMWIRTLGALSAEDARALDDVFREADRHGVQRVGAFDRSAACPAAACDAHARLEALGLVMAWSGERVPRPSRGAPLEEVVLPAAPTDLGVQFRRAVTPRRAPPAPASA